ncbi:translational activator of GCN4 [Kappamyces sp. JEL0680]|nr:translational activator of GCN4 [Kappamyces sp. JEL0680]
MGWVKEHQEKGACIACLIKVILKKLLYLNTVLGKHGDWQDSVVVLLLLLEKSTNKGLLAKIALKGIHSIVRPGLHCAILYYYLNCVLAVWPSCADQGDVVTDLLISLLDGICTSEQGKSRKLAASALERVATFLKRHPAALQSSLASLFKKQDAAQLRLIFLLDACASTGHGEILSSYRSKMQDYLSKVVLASKTSVHKTYLNALATTVSLCIDAKAFAEMGAASQKLLLRSPEVVLDVLVAIVSFVDFDTSESFKSQFADALLAQLKSSNDFIRTSTIRLYKILADKSADTASLCAVADIVLKGIASKNPVGDQKSYFFTVVKNLAKTREVALRVLPALETLCSKETNEAALAALVAAYASHAAVLLESNGDAKAIEATVSFLIKGLRETKPMARKAFMLSINDAATPGAVSQLGSPLQSKLFAELLGQVVKMQAAPVSLIDGKKDSQSLGEALAGLHCLLVLYRANNELDVSSVAKDTLNASSSNSFFFVERFYSKAAGGEQLYLAQSLFIVLEDPSLFLPATENGSDALAQLLLWLHIHGSVEVKRWVAEKMTGTATTSDGIAQLSRLVRSGVVAVLDNATLPDSLWNDTPARSSTSIAQAVVSAITGTLPRNASEELLSITQDTLFDFFVVCSHPIIVRSFGTDLWIRLCFRSGIPPTFIASYDRSRFDTWFSLDASDPSLGGMNPQFHEGFRTATLSALKLAAQIAPRLVIPLALEWSQSVLRREEYSSVSIQDVEILHTPEGQIVFDPLERKTESFDTKGLTKDQKWELELKKELLAKKSKAGTEPKRTKAEQEIYNAQLKKESEIRARVAALQFEVEAAVSVLDSVFDATIADTLGNDSRDLCIANCDALLDSFLGVLSREWLVTKSGKSHVPSGVLVGRRIIPAFEKFSQIVLGALHPVIDYRWIHFNMFAALGFDTSLASGLVYPKYQDELLSESVLELLNQINELAQESEPLSPPAFAFIFPILQAIVLRQGRIPTLKERVYTEVVMACADVLIAHAAIEGNDTLFLPRKAMVECLLLLIEHYPRLRTAAKGGLLALTIATSHLELADEEELEDHEDRVEVLITDMSTVMLHGLLNGDGTVRESCLTGLGHLPFVDSIRRQFDVRVWLCKSDDEDAVFTEAEAIWSEVYSDAVLDVDYLADLAALVAHSHSAIRSAAGRALCEALRVYEAKVLPTLLDLFALYKEKAADPVPEFDGYGMVIPESLNKPDQWEARSGIALALASCEPVITSHAAVMEMFQFLIEEAALGDKNETVQQQMLTAGLAVLESGGKSFIQELLDLFDDHLSKPAGTSVAQDVVREAVVILMGTLAHHLDPSDSRVTDTVQKLVDTLKTPSESVQIAVSECLPGLIKINKEPVPRLVKELLDMLFNSEKYGHRRGAAYGIAGLVKGTGISALKDYSIMAHLKDAVEDKKHITRREGALFAFETLSFTLGRTFEPYVIQLLPHLLICYGDANRQIRDATEDTCRVIMSKLSAHCVKLVLPSLLNGLQERAFRTKIGSIEVMASMSALAPKQLGQSLPTIVPKICEALGDSHQKVQDAAQDALGQFGKVIKNPEIQQLVPTLIGALVNPNNKTQAALSALLDTTFVHYIDAPSLALLVPIIHRGMKERSAETKKKAAKIMGNMASLTEPRDLIPYLDTLLPPLKEVLVDPVPEARATSARAFGTMVEKLGEEKFPGLVTEMLTTLQSDASGVDRSGAAQGLSEIISGVGVERLESLLPLILNNANSTKATTREGFMMLLVYLPSTFGEKFTPYIIRVVPTMLEGLADESDTVRDAALHLGQVIVRNYAKSAVNLLLPELQKGLFNDNWRIRQNSIQLIGDLIFRIAGITQKVETDDAEEGFGTELHRNALRSALGDQYETVLASLFIVRADSSGLVRQTAVGVWKAIVANTPRTLKQILPVLMNILLGSLASDSHEKRGVAARTLGDLVRRLGEGVLKLIIPILRDGLETGDSDTREGVCIGLCEMMQSAGKSVDEFMEQCIPLIRVALIDSSADVRTAAAQAFDILHQNLGSKAIDDVIPALLGGLKSDSNGYALEGLKEIMAVRSSVVFPVLIPTLLTRPITKLNAQALGSLISVAGPALNRRLDTIIPTLLTELEEETKAKEEIMSALEAIMLSIEEDGVYRVIGILTETITDGALNKRIIACQCLAIFFAGTSEPFDDFLVDAIRLVVGLFSDASPELVQESWKCFDAIVKRLRKDDQEKFVFAVRNGLRDAESRLSYGEEVAAFQLPKGISPILSILLQGLMTGGAEVREAAAYGLGDVITRTSEASLKPFVTQITGPLIRVIGDRFAASVKTAILSTLALLLSKVPSMLKPFLPQLQRTFVKALSEAGGTSAMRSKTAQCLSALIPLQTRLDPLVLELVQGIKSADEGVEPAMWDALYGLLNGVSRSSDKNISEASQNSILALIHEKLVKSGENEGYQRVGSAKCFGVLSNVLPLQRSRELLMGLVSTSAQEGWTGLHGMLLGIERVYIDAPETVNDTDFADVAADRVLECLKDGKSVVADAAVHVAAQLLGSRQVGDPSSLVSGLVELSQPSSEHVDARREAIVALKNVAKFNYAPLLHIVVPALMLSVRDRTIPIKLAAERALVYVLQIKESFGTVDAYVKANGPTAKSIADYAKRVLSKIAERDSDEETEDY